MSKKFKRILSMCTNIIFLTVLLLNGSFFKVNVFAADTTISLSIKNKIDVALALGNSSVNVSTFEQDLKNALTARGVAATDVNISAVKASNVSVENNFNWWVYDHYNTNLDALGTAYNAPLVSDINHQYVEPYNEVNQNFNLKRHISVEDGGQTMTMRGYGAPAYKDFMYMENTEATKKTFEFQVQEISAFDALDGGGFFFNTTVTGNYTNKTQVMSGYLLFLEYDSNGKGSSMKIYKFENVNTYNLHSGANGNIANNLGVTLLATSANYSGTDIWRKIKIEAYPTSLKVWYRGGTTENASNLIDSNIVNWTLNNSGKTTEVILPSYAAPKSNGFGPMISYRTHSCPRLTEFKFKNLTMAADKVKSLTEVIREPEWRTSSQKYVINLNEGVIADFNNNQMTAELISRLNSDGISYVGWGNNSNQAQTAQFLQRNNDRGKFVNMNSLATDTYAEQISATADYIAANYTTTLADDYKYVLTSDKVDFFVSGASTTNTSDVNWPNGRWKVNHDITGFDNANGYVAFNNQYKSDLTLEFSKPGKYEVYYEDKIIRTIYSHERPTASFNAINNSGNVIYTDNSVDPDRKNQTDKGIVETQWKYMNLTNGDSNWTSGQLTTATTGMTYLIALKVQDEFGLWSQECTKQLYTGVSPIKPFADFDITTGITLKLEDKATIVDKSYDAAGSPITKHNWTVKKNGNPYAKTINLATSSILDFSGDGIGTYVLSLTVESANGTSEVITRTVVVASIPGAPTAVSVVAGRGNATVSFTPPSSNGGSSIAGYTVVSSPGNIKAIGSASPIKIDGLDPLQSYTFTVYATNSIGDGQVSSPSNVTTILSPAVITIVPYNTNPTNQNITVTAQKSDGTLNATNHTFTENGSFDFVLTDKYGNKVTKTVTITNIDKVAPITPTLLADNNLPTNSDVAVTITYPLDANIKEYKIGNGAWTSYTAPVVVSANAIIYAQCKDAAGNVSTISSLTVSNIDKVNPVISITGNPTNWTKNNVLLYISTNVGTSAIKSVTIQKDGEALIDITGQSNYTVTTNGSYKFVLTNGAGITSSSTVNVTNIDKTAPTDLTISFKGNSFKTFLNKISFGIFAKESVKIDISTNGDISGTNYIEYQLIDANKSESYDAINGTWVKYSSLVVAPQFKGMVYARAMDNAGNMSAVVSSNGLVVDNEQPTLPVINSTVDGNSYIGEWTSKDIVVVASGSLALAGVNYYEYKVGTDGIWTKMPGSTGQLDIVSGMQINDKLTIIENVEDTYYFRAVSGSGVIGTETSKEVKHDKNADIIIRANAIPKDYDGLFFQKGNIQTLLDEIAALTPEEKTLLITTNDNLNDLLATIALIQANIDATIAVIPVVTSIETGTTTNNLPIISGTGYPGSIITIYNNGVAIGTTTVNPDGTWSFTPKTALPEGTNVITTKSTHKTGFYGQESAPITLKVDTQILRNAEADAANLSIIYADGDSADSVTKALYLTKIGGKNSVITWSSSKSTTITNTGRVTRPEPESQDEVVILTATIAAAGTNTLVTKKFNLTVKKLSDQDAANEAAKKLTAQDAFSFDSAGDNWESVTNRMLLLTKGSYNSTISWSSNKTSIIDITSKDGNIMGSVTRPEKEDETVILTATIKKGNATAKKTFLITVKQKNVTKQEETTRAETNTNATIGSGTSEELVSVNIMRTTLDNNAGIIDTLVLTNDLILKLTDGINPKSDSSARTVTINMTQPKDGTALADEQAVEIHALAVQSMAERNVMLEVNIGDVIIKIDSEELKAISDSGIDLYFKVLPIKNAVEKSELSERTKSNQLAIALGKGIVPEGVPYTIETNYSGFKTKLVIPFNGIVLPTENLNSFLESLKVYVEHTDGTKEVLGGTIIYENSKPVGLEISIDRFSNFQIFSTPVVKENANLPKTGSNVDTLTLLSLGMLLTFTGIGMLGFRRKRKLKINKIV